MRPFDTFVSERHRRLLSMSASVSILTLVLIAELNGTAALAQASQGSAVDRPSPAQARNNDDDSNAIVVTARRKEESLTDVPASITAYSSDFFKKQNIQTFADYATKLPNVTFQYGQGGDFSSVGFVGGRQTTIRGVAGANTTAYYINDTPHPVGRN
ncbi:MAG: Plug domain-containing protein, partial [Alphaproteobacteria bacterium]|nr:Plug domain-containing protein [Alphaproteobacteria bacterium]